MRKAALFTMLACMILLASGCSRDFAFDDGSASVSLTYNGYDYACVSQDQCPYKYDSKDMVYLYSLKSGELSGLEPGYSVYRHKDDKDAEYLFVIPKPSVRDATPFAFVMRVKN